MCIHLLEHKKWKIQKKSFTEADFKIMLLSLPLTLRVYQTHFLTNLMFANNSGSIFVNSEHFNSGGSSIII